MAELPADLAALPALRGAGGAVRLTAGPVSDKWRVEMPAGPVVVRRDRPLAATLGLSRQRELACLSALASEGWQPAPVHADPAAGLLITAFLPGDSWDAGHYRDPLRLRRLGKLLAALHALPVSVPAMDIASVLRDYANLIGTDDASHSAAYAAGLLAGMEPARRCLCHNDVTGGNVVENSGRLGLIDWEYAGAGDVAFELAAVIEQHGLEAGGIAVLLEAYGFHAGWQGGPGGAERLDNWREIYRITARLWAEAVGLPGRR